MRNRSFLQIFKISFRDLHRSQIYLPQDKRSTAEVRKGIDFRRSMSPAFPLFQSYFHPSQTRFSSHVRQNVPSYSSTRSIPSRQHSSFLPSLGRNESMPGPYGQVPIRAEGLSEPQGQSGHRYERPARVVRFAGKHHGSLSFLSSHINLIFRRPSH